MFSVKISVDNQAQVTLPDMTETQVRAICSGADLWTATGKTVFASFPSPGEDEGTDWFFTFIGDFIRCECCGWPCELGTVDSDRQCKPCGDVQNAYIRSKSAT